MSPGQASRGVRPGFLVRGSLGYARSWAKNIVKAALGRKPHFTPHDVLFRLYLRRLRGGPKLRKITSDASAGEGAGSQALMTMRAIDFARRTGLTYVHTPFSDIYYADRPMQAWADAWEAHFNLGLGEVRDDRDAGDTVNFAFTFSALHVLFGVEELEPDFDDATIREFRRRYYANKSPRKNEILSICVHARRRNRNDVPSDPTTDLACLARVLARVRSVLDPHRIDYTLRIFSQGEVEEFCDLDVPASALFLDVDPLWSMREMIEADILVTALGTFSYVAGLLSDGIVLGATSETSAQGWLAYDANGDFDSDALGRAVTSLPSTSVR